MTMKIVKRLLDDVVLYAGEDIDLEPNQATGAGWVDQRTTTANATLIDGVSLPPDWIGGAYKYINGAWLVADRSLLPVPTSVTPLQARRALRHAGLSDAVAAWIATQDADTQDAWEYAVEVLRTDPAIQGAADALGITAAQIDDLFRLAATL